MPVQTVSNEDPAMATFEDEARLREVQVPVAAEALFARPLFRLPLFVITTLLGAIAIILDIRLDIAAWSGTRLHYDALLWLVGCIIVSAWFAITSHLEDVRAFYLNESGFSGEQRLALSIALMSDFRVALGGLFTLYVAVIMLLLVVSRLLIRAAF
jgi:hypothetical protein